MWRGRAGSPSRFERSLSNVFWCPFLLAGAVDEWKMEPPASLIPVALRHVSSCQLNSSCMFHASLLAHTLHYMKTHILDSTEFVGSNLKIILWLETYIFIIGILTYSFPPSICDSGSCWKKNTECQSEIPISEAHMEPLPVNCHCWTLQIQLHIFKATFSLWTYSMLLQMKNPSEFKLWRLFPCRIAKIKFKMLKKEVSGLGGIKKKSFYFKGIVTYSTERWCTWRGVYSQIECMHACRWQRCCWNKW